MARRATLELEPQVVRSRRVLTAAGLVPAAIHLAGGTIAAVGPHDEVPAGASLLEAGDLVVLPGLVDTHVHLNEPGRSDWEGFATGTRAAAAGGVTTVIDMPLNSIPATTDVAALRAKRAAAAGQLAVDVGFWGGVVPGNGAARRALWEEGVFGFKCFLAPSGVAEFPHVAADELRAALAELAALGAPLLAHAELPAVLDAAAAATAGLPPQRYASWLAARPPAAEVAAIELLLRLAEETGARVHVVHLATGEALPMLGAARARGLAVSVETCPHYLCFAAEEVADGATELKCAPPIRGRDESERLWRALEEGAIDLVASDHSPCPPALKRRQEGDFFAAWGGIASLELGLPAMWTAARQRGLGIAALARWMGAAPAALCGLPHKGRLAPGCAADLVLFDDRASRRVDPARLHQRHPLTPYASRRLAGVVATTLLRGRVVFHHGEHAGPHGRLLRRGAAA